MRGSLRLKQDVSIEDGIIPAHAGLTMPSHTAPARPRDHPRACGAHRQAAGRSKVVMGSSPRMRGSRLKHCLSMRFAGIIPAHAGLTAVSIRSILHRWDHPRACGAHCPTAYQNGHSAGSSPRMRGSPECTLEYQLSLGIIPAHAGLTPCHS